MQSLCKILRESQLVLKESQSTLVELGKTLRQLSPLLHTIDELLLRFALVALVAYHLWKLWHS